MDQGGWPQRAFDGFLQLKETDRGLVEVGGGARLHAVLDVGWHALGSDHDGRDVRQVRVAAHLPENIEPRDFRIMMSSRTMSGLSAVIMAAMAGAARTS
ncbi:MAG: hypothetical protein MZV70_17730 [Desulfobacterales bacterium]|nr:hypothetical protein [Desulfobacterales bacterium]